MNTRAAGVAELLVGDAVRMNSGGPLMTVYDFHDDGTPKLNFVIGTCMHFVFCQAWMVQRVDRRAYRKA